MTTSILTPNTPNALTGFANPVLGWLFTAATALDTFEGCNIVFAAGWVAQLGPLSNSPPTAPIWEITFSKHVALANGVDSLVNVLVNDTDYFAFDGQNVWNIPQATVSSDYTVTTQG